MSQASEGSADDASDAQATLAPAPARCRRTDEALSLAAGSPFDVPNSVFDIGAVVSTPSGLAVSFAADTAHGRMGGVGLLARDPLRVTRVVALGPTLTDAPPPVLGWRGPEVVAAMSGVHEGIELYAIAGDGPLVAPLVVPQHDPRWTLDLAFSGSAGALVWGDATSSSRGGPQAARGIIREALVARDHTAPVRDISPPEADADSPRIVPSRRAGQAFDALWIAHQPEPPVADAAESEAIGEPREFGWLEMVALDEHGDPVGPVRDLTRETGHVTGFDVQTLPTGLASDAGTAAPTLIVVARDDGEAVDGSGGALLRVLVKGDAIQAPVAFETDGLGRGEATLVVSAAPDPPSLALAWSARDESERLLPLDFAGSPAAAASLEDSLKDASPLRFLSGAGGTGDPSSSRALLVDAPGDVAAELRVFACGK
jgi:hypothetical protein